MLLPLAFQPFIDLLRPYFIVYFFVLSFLTFNSLLLFLLAILLFPLILEWQSLRLKYAMRHFFATRWWLKSLVLHHCLVLESCIRRIVFARTCALLAFVSILLQVGLEVLNPLVCPLFTPSKDLGSLGRFLFLLQVVAYLSICVLLNLFNVSSYSHSRCDFLLFNLRVCNVNVFPLNYLSRLLLHVYLFVRLLLLRLLLKSFVRALLVINHIQHWLVLHWLRLLIQLRHLFLLFSAVLLLLKHLLLLLVFLEPLRLLSAFMRCSLCNHAFRTLLF